LPTAKLTAADINVKQEFTSKSRAWTPLLAKFVEALPNLIENKKVILAKIAVDTSYLMPIGLLENVPHRHFVYSVKLIDVEVTWDPKEGELGATSALNAQQTRDAIKNHRKTIQN
jgi:hypothetical protein